MIDDKLIERLAKLSKLKVEDDNIKKDLEEILEFVENLNELDLDNISAFDNLNTTYLREDEVFCDKEIVDGILNNAKVEDNYFIVPKIIE